MLFKQTGLYVLTAILTALFSLSAIASTQSEKSGFAFGVGAGTTGFTGTGTFRLSKNFNARLIYANFDEQDTSVESGINYNIDLDLTTTSLLLDYHPFASSGFRLSIGAVKNGINISGTSTQSTGTISVGNSNFNAAQVGTLNASIEYDDIAPYFGIGWGNAVNKSKSLTLAVDLGIIQMDTPQVTITSSGADPTIQNTLNAELANEASQLSQDFDDFDLYPVFNLSLNYQF